ncbi:hypothetical protein QJS10_CPB21g01378 [Acorus calamus]|uniref:Uncharacterized protein n=1 Tax=Acorus calamus TaxID=4465 RepID=A0AAV9C8S9_ACOCL|nr:hypothetical protein QJS10_CPB21g01378 [Acorus calamus]
MKGTVETTKLNLQKNKAKVTQQWQEVSKSTTQNNEKLLDDAMNLRHISTKSALKTFNKFSTLQEVPEEEELLTIGPLVNGAPSTFDVGKQCVKDWETGSKKSVKEVEAGSKQSSRQSVKDLMGNLAVSQNIQSTLGNSADTRSSKARSVDIDGSTHAPLESCHTGDSLPQSNETGQTTDGLNVIVDLSSSQEASQGSNPPPSITKIQMKLMKNGRSRKSNALPPTKKTGPNHKKGKVQRIEPIKDFFRDLEEVTDDLERNTNANTLDSPILNGTVYASNDYLERRILWSTITSLSAAVNGHPWIVGGDFNEVRFSNEKQDGRPVHGGIWKIGCSRGVYKFFGRSLKDSNVHDVHHFVSNVRHPIRANLLHLEYIA